MIKLKIAVVAKDPEEGERVLLQVLKKWALEIMRRDLKLMEQRNWHWQ